MGSCLAGAAAKVETGVLIMCMASDMSGGSLGSRILAWLLCKWLLSGFQGVGVVLEFRMLVWLLGFRILVWPLVG